MKKKIAMIVAICFLSTFVAGPTYAWNDNDGVTEKFGRGGLIEERKSGTPNTLKAIGWMSLGVAAAIGISYGVVKLVNWVTAQPLQSFQSQPPAAIQSQQNQPVWQNPSQPTPATYNVAEPF